MRAAPPDVGALHRVVEVPAAARPLVSIIVLAWQAADAVLHCLDSVSRSLLTVPGEAVVLANGATAEVQRAVSERVRGIRLMHAGVNLGFGTGCNTAAEVAAAPYLLFLNDDAELRPGAVEAMLETLDGDPGVAAVGGRLVFPDGRLQEAGCVIWSDGSTTQVGWGESGHAGRWLVPRAVPYCSATALLVRADAFRALGGFSDAYYPAYFEDADLCLSLWQNGGRVVYQPAAEVLHRQSTSSPLDFRDFLYTRNREVFARRWAGLLDAAPVKPTTDAEVTAAAARQADAAPEWLLARSPAVAGAPGAAVTSLGSVRARRPPRARARTPRAVPEQREGLAEEIRHLALDLAVTKTYAVDLRDRLDAVHRHCHQVALERDWHDAQRRHFETKAEQMWRRTLELEAELAGLRQRCQPPSRLLAAGYCCLDRMYAAFRRHPVAYGWARWLCNRLAPPTTSAGQ